MNGREVDNIFLLLVFLLFLNVFFSFHINKLRSDFSGKKNKGKIAAKKF